MSETSSEFLQLFFPVSKCVCFFKHLFILYIPGTQMTSIFEGHPGPPQNKASFQSKQVNNANTETAQLFHAILVLSKT